MLAVILLIGLSCAHIYATYIECYTYVLGTESYPVSSFLRSAIGFSILASSLQFLLLEAFFVDDLSEFAVLAFFPVFFVFYGCLYLVYQEKMKILSK
ncbi:hypothetical protein RJ45_05125 [Photobacterium gaetbulicola]|uniref:Uncharacterized protein n=1 Tax=Photobacterium gaetbulicola TaxID=1295392 RepID=A0A0B9H1A0_9GAMM|nr:hypothetical protein [Photobacterium gaetbulicola]KHT64691.1 hypothetical protein RJ45_05125 [Photobacterium gaetbulicola]